MTTEQLFSITDMKLSYGQWQWTIVNHMDNTSANYRTNAAGEGIFNHVHGKHDPQIAGTTQFSLRSDTGGTISQSAARSRIARYWFKNF